MWSLAGSQAVDQQICCFGPELLGPVHGQLASAPSAHSPEVSGVGTLPGFQVWVSSWGFSCWPQSTNLGVRNQASGEPWGCLSCVHSPGAEGGGAKEATAAAESSLNSCCMPLFSLFLFEKFFLFKPPWSKQAPGLSHSQAWLSPKNPAADTVPQPGVSASLVPVLVPGTLLSLSTLLTIRSFNVLYLWSLIFIYAGIPLAVHSVPQIS